MQVPYCIEEKQKTTSLVSLLQETALFLWKDWPMEMKYSSGDDREFVIAGECPHPSCRKQAAFPTVSSFYEEKSGGHPYRRIAAARCIACNEYILAIIRASRYSSGVHWEYEAHYPLGLPDDEVAEEIPDTIKPDFREALRCRWVGAYNATVEMCRRALEASCLEQGAPANLVLNNMIDWVHAQGKITTPLKEMAHKIRLGGDRGAHPSERIMNAEDADAVIEFTREYFDAVYVMPARMGRFDFSRPKPVKK